MTRSYRLPLLLVLLLSGCSLLAQTTQASLPKPEEVIQGIMGRASAVARSKPTNVWTFDKRTVVEELSLNGTARSRVEKFYRAKVVKNIPFSRLVRMSGRNLTPAELAREDKREADFRKRFMGRDPEAVVKSTEPLIPKELLDRFSYTVVRREELHGRAVLFVTFAPKLPLRGNKSIQDRFLNRLAGSFRVDEASGEVAVLDAKLTEGFSLGFLGMLGSIRSFELHLYRVPMPDGTWVPEVTEGRFSTRILLSNDSQHLREVSSNYRSEPIEGS